MRTNLCRNMKSLFFCNPYHLYRIFCGTMAQMQLCTGIFTEHNISRNNDILHGIRDTRHTKFFCLGIRIHYPSVYHINVLTVCQYRNMIFCCLKHSLAVHFCIHNRFTIFTDCRDSGFYHSLDISKLLAHLSLGDSSNL